MVPVLARRQERATKEGSCWASPGARAMAHSTRAMEAIVTLKVPKLDITDAAII
jgi:hypothetical protein